MALDRIVLYVVVGVAVALAAVYGGLILFGALSLGPVGLLVLIPLFLVAYVIWRIVAERLSNREDDHYEQIER
ncbi:MAG: hypothetical protein AAFX62_00460 [Pseudomonadota bacterium]